MKTRLAPPPQAARPTIRASAAPPPRSPAPIQALPDDKPNDFYDGALMSGDGKFYPAGTPYEMLQPVRPDNGKVPTKTLVYINGLGEERHHTQTQLQVFANGTGQNIVGIYNATRGRPRDMFEVFKDKLDIGRNPAVSSLARLLYAKVIAGERVRIIGNSQGGGVMERALHDVRERLLKLGLSSHEAEQKMSVIEVETFCAAAANFPDGPQYVHYVNMADLVPRLTGLTRPLAHPGRGAVVREFNTWNPLSAHDTELHFQHYVPFEVARR
jgi:pimeloyl-ACP methyl ester carboxylesterase